jgi:hypothetical protein
LPPRAPSRPRRAPASRVVLGGALLLQGCSSLSSLPLVGSGTNHSTNPAAEACLRKADELGLERAGERQATPTGEGRYTVVLDVLGQGGFTQVTCSYDPATGAQVEKPKRASP